MNYVLRGNSYIDQELDSVIRLKPTGRKPPCVIIECHSSHTVTKIPEPPKTVILEIFWPCITQCKKAVQIKTRRNDVTQKMTFCRTDGDEDK